MGHVINITAAGFTSQNISSYPVLSLADMGAHFSYKKSLLQKGGGGEFEHSNTVRHASVLITSLPVFQYTLGDVVNITPGAFTSLVSWYIF